MTTSFTRIWQRFVCWLRRKGAPTPLGATSGGWSFVDALHRVGQPSAGELMAELKSIVFACASLNAGVCASFPPRLFVTTTEGQSPPKCRTRKLDPLAERRLLRRLHPHKACAIEEVVDHPLLTLLRQVNPIHNSFDLWELTTLYQEVFGNAYWHIVFGPLGTPAEIWILPAQHITPRREPESSHLVDYYEYQAGGRRLRFAPGEIIHFRYPDPRDPYLAGLSPLRAAWEQAVLHSDYVAFKKARIDNRAIPDAIVSPDEVIGRDEIERLEMEWNDKFRRGGAGRVLVAESGMRVQLLNHTIGDVAQLAEMGQTKEDIANAFGVPLAFLTSETNLANLQAAEHQHLSKAIAPRLKRRDEKLNEKLVPLFDPTGRLFLASDDPVPQNVELEMQQQEQDLRLGVLSINEVRRQRGLPPVSWGDQPWLPLQWAPADFLPRQESDLSNIGRNATPSDSTD
ncbi:MAG: hypothetical protein KatS3mg105_1255 [Gemmatales bacterium]|nr:MAG: hypothetical protein KatS3mg105_1255 [Gemmatales bacterium]